MQAYYSTQVLNNGCSCMGEQSITIKFEDIGY